MDASFIFIISFREMIKFRQMTTRSCDRFLNYSSISNELAAESVEDWTDLDPRLRWPRFPVREFQIFKSKWFRWAVGRIEPIFRHFCSFMGWNAQPSSCLVSLSGWSLTFWPKYCHLFRHACQIEIFKWSHDKDVVKRCVVVTALVLRHCSGKASVVRRAIE